MQIKGYFMAKNTFTAKITFKLLFIIILKYMKDHAIEKLNTKLFYHSKLNHIPLHFTDLN